MVLSVHTYGEGRPVVLLPWFALDNAVTATAFEPVFAATSGWRRLYLDLPGTGGSQPVAPTSDAVLDAVAETIRDLVGDSSYAVTGCSYGDYFARALARRNPARVAGLLLVCAGVKILPAERDLSGLVASTPEPGWLDAVPQQPAVGTQTPAVARRVFEVVDRSRATDEYLDHLRATGYRLSDETPRTGIPVPPRSLPGRETVSPATWTSSARSPATRTATTTR